MSIFFREILHNCLYILSVLTLFIQLGKLSQQFSLKSKIVFTCFAKFSIPLQTSTEKYLFSSVTVSGCNIYLQDNIQARYLIKQGHPISHRRNRRDCEPWSKYWNAISHSLGMWLGMTGISEEFHIFCMLTAFVVEVLSEEYRCHKKLFLE